VALVQSTNLGPGSADPQFSLPAATFAELSKGVPLLGSLSLKYLRDVGMYIYENPQGEARVAIADADQLPLLETIAWTLQRQLVAELASPEDIASALDGAGAHEARLGQLPDPVRASDYLENGEDTIDALRDLAHPGRWNSHDAADIYPGAWKTYSVARENTRRAQYRRTEIAARRTNPGPGW
jgi:Type II secretion system (T2SS), protein E, N-terminal domain